MTVPDPTTDDVTGEYTPPIERIRDEYVRMRAEHYGFTDLYAAEFDRALAERDAHVRAEALREAADEIERRRGDVHHWVNPVIGWLRLAERDGDSLSPQTIHNVVTQLHRAIAAADGEPFAQQMRVENPDPTPAPVLSGEAESEPLNVGVLADFVEVGRPGGEGGWVCSTCGYGSTEHGMTGHPSFACVYQPAWKPLTPAPVLSGGQADGECTGQVGCPDGCGGVLDDGPLAARPVLSREAVLVALDAHRYLCHSARGVSPRWEQCTCGEKFTGAAPWRMLAEHQADAVLDVLARGGVR